MALILMITSISPKVQYFITPMFQSLLEIQCPEKKSEIMNLHFKD